MASAFSPYMVVAAFDFGTTYSGYAFSYRDKPTLVQTNQAWDDGSGNTTTMKTSTCVLLTPDHVFDSFGYDAENKYYSLAAENTHHGWLLFRRFKMLLHNNEVSDIPFTIYRIFIKGKIVPGISCILQFEIGVIIIGLVEKNFLSA